MKHTLARAISVLVVLFALSLTAYGCENSPAHKATHDPGNIDPAVIAMADKILAEQAEASITDGDNFAVASNKPHSVRSTESRRASVSKWMEDRAVRASAAESKTKPVAKNAHTHYQDIEADMGGGWCDLCGCWMRHGRDPNGTPQSEIGHPYVCQGGASTQNCWSHYYKYCFGS